MKRFFNYVLILLVMIFPFMSVNAAEEGKKVNLYVFYGSTCSHCADLHTVLAELEEDKEYNYMFEVVDYEVWSDSKNATLMQDVAEYLGTTAQGVPFYVVGDYYAEGFPDISSTDASVKKAVNQVIDDLKSAIKKAYDAANADKPTYEDIVAAVGSGNATVKEKTAKKSGSNDVVGYIILGATVIVIVAIIFGRSSTKDEEEELAEALEAEEKEEAVEEAKPKKAPAKKATAKKTTTTKKAATKTTAKKTTTKKASTAKKTTAKKTTKKTK